ncbi:diacylglycerol kinase family protein [Rummeliibacillus pycnus]|uniref:diacylglycerol kinase family protein n=1 Tax=Rummeliibacillus pycnus TaxID=101070 RepID=UPI003D2C84E3
MDVRKFFRSFKYAIEGIRQVMAEQNFRFDLMVAFIVIVAGAFTGLSKIEWMILVMVITIMLSLEMINTAIERVVDLASPEKHPLAKAAKDISAGAVFVFACASVIIGILIFLPKWINLWI